MPATILIEKKQFILKMSPVDVEKSPKFPKCSHNVQNKMNGPLTQSPLNEDIDNFRYNTMHDMLKQFVTIQDQDESPQDAIKDPQKILVLEKQKPSVNHKKEYYYNEPDNEAKDISDLLNYETLIESHSVIKLPVKRTTTTTKGKEIPKPKHHNKYIYYTPDNDDATQVVDITTKPHKAVTAYWSQQTQKIHHIIKPVVTHRTHHTKIQKIQPKENPKRIKPTPIIEHPVPVTHSLKHKSKEHLGHTTHNTQSTTLTTEKHTTSHEIENMAQLEFNSDTSNFGVDIYLSTIQPYFNELQKQKTAVMKKGYFLTDNGKVSMKNGQGNDLQSTSVDRIYNKLLKPKIMKILKIDKSKRFLEDQDDTTEEPGKDKAVPTTAIHEFNNSMLP